MDKLERQRVASKKWYNKNKQALAEKRRGNRKEEHIKSYKRKISLLGKEEINRLSREKRGRDPQLARDRQNKYRRDNVELKLCQAAKARCNKSGLEFNITKDDIIIPEYCPLLGIKLTSSNLHNHDFCPSLDRIDNSKGYVKGNIWVISFKANRMKNTATIEELISFANGILNCFNQVKYEDLG